METWGTALDRQELGPQARGELRALREEQDPELFFAGLIDFANHELNRNHAASAALAYQTVAEQAGAFPDLAAKARRRLEALQGGGQVGDRVEFLLRDLAKQSAEPASLFAMGAAGFAFRLARLGALSGLATSPFAKAWLSPGTRSLAASLAGFAVEVPTFTFAAKAAYQALGRSPDWSSRSVARDLTSAALVLGGLKLGGLASASLERSLQARLSGSFNLPSSAFQQGGMLAGIYLGHGLEVASGLSEKRDAASTFVNSLATLLQFNIAGRLSPGFLTQDLTRLEVASAQAGGSSSPGTALVQAFQKLAPAGSGRDPKLLAENLVLNSSNEKDGRDSPRPSFDSADSYRGSSSKPPVEDGTILRDALAWGASQGRSSTDVTRMSNFVEDVRVEMWNALNLYVDKPLARALGQSKQLYVRVQPVDGSLDKYQIELSAVATPREVHAEYVEFLLDANEGTLELHDLPSQAALIRRYQAQGIDPQRSFLGYYRSLSGFETPALQSAHLVAAMPANVRALVLQPATQYHRQLPAPAADPVPKYKRAPEPEPQVSTLVRYFPYVAEQARQEVESFAANAGIRDQHLTRLQGLVQKLLVGLYTRESAEPRLTRFAYLQGRMRPDPETPNKRIIEILTPAEAMKRPLQKEDVLFNLVRFPSATGDPFAYLHHILINTDAQGLPTRGADLRFQQKLGINFNLKVRLNALSMESFDEAAAQTWLKENGYIQE